MKNIKYPVLKYYCIVIAVTFDVATSKLVKNIVIS